MLNTLLTTLLPIVPKRLIWQFSSQYIAGETVEEALTKIKALNDAGIMGTLDLLGEFFTTLDQAERTKDEYLSLIEKAEKSGVNTNYSLKPTSFGLLNDAEVSYHFIREVVEKAALHGNFIRIDMEDSNCTDLEIKLFRRLKEEFTGYVGLVFQAYLKRTLTDISTLSDLHSPRLPLNLRLCKGIYIEPESIAYKGYDEINHHFLEDLEYMLAQKMYPAIATHDPPIIEGAYRLIKQYQVDSSSYEFQMLYGVTPGLRKKIVNQGHRMRVYVPYGKQWHPYCIRRLKENPRMAGMILKALFKKG